MMIPDDDHTVAAALAFVSGTFLGAGVGWDGLTIIAAVVAAVAVVVLAAIGGYEVVSRD